MLFRSYSYPMRSKEDAQDYRYFPDPDLTPVVISDEMIREIRDRQPEFRTEKKARYMTTFNLPEYDADILTGTKRLADIFEAATAVCHKPKKVSNWLMVETMRLLKEREMDADRITFSPAHLAELIDLVDAGTVNSSVAKEVFEKIFDEDVEPKQYVEEHGLKMENDRDALREAVEGVVEANPQSVADYRAGKKKAMGYLVGQTMKVTGGKANPAAVNEMLREILEQI